MAMSPKPEVAQRSPHKPQSSSRNAVDKAFQLFLAFLNKTRSRQTKQRLEIARHVLSYRKPFKLEDIQQSIDRVDASAGPKSIANTIEYLHKCGLIMAHEHKQQTHFLSLARPDNTLLLYCFECQHMQETLLPNAERHCQRISKARDFTLSHTTRVMKGHCSACKQKLQRLRPDSMLLPPRSKTA